MSMEKLVRITIVFKKNPSLSDEQFHEYWAHTHAPLCTDWLRKFGIIKYTQHHLHKTGAEFIEKTLPGWPTASYDGIEDFYVRELKQFTDAILDDHYQKHLMPDGGVFADFASIFIVVGEDYVVIDDNDVVEKHERDYRIKSI
ncbi:hypothetical protein Dda_2001 [Drechslerella dactyloides]|uniref:EthD domain-containing protein n=1 Tax=Drechslerella dactyloides TaxID=74499 RepID=A0AAD6NNI7_DREDA|nr:hypothetical protein Dda_2001 [Drechslerella dactyloides]